jgi:hypothetical protein
MREFELGERWSNKCAAANRRPATRQPDGWWQFLIAHCGRRTLSAAVAELGHLARP